MLVASLQVVGGRVVCLGVVGGVSAPFCVWPTRLVAVVPGYFAGQTQVLSLPLDGMQ